MKLRGAYAPGARIRPLSASPPPHSAGGGTRVDEPQLQSDSASQADAPVSDGVVVAPGTVTGSPPPSDPAPVRRVTLDEVFDPKTMRSTWHKVVRPRFRRQDVLDLHDYYDYNRNIVPVLELIHADILTGKYRPRQPQDYRLEKGQGVCRRIYLPSPEDAIVLQCLVDSIGPSMMAMQPSRNSFYSQDQQRLDEQFLFENSDPYDWASNWELFQKSILQFTSGSKYMVVTDIANYFDAISLRQLRNTLSSLTSTSESLLDFLFFMLDEFIWRPNYVPSSGVGLPQVDFNAPRLLAHVFLFDVDGFLKSQVGDNFARWMDDIQIGVGSIDQGRRILGRLDDMMRIKGIRLNSGKTRILSSEDAIRHYCAPENQKVTLLGNCVSCAIENNIGIDILKKNVRTRFRKWWNGSRYGNWSKVVKRYITLFTRLNDPYLERYAPEALREYSELRGSIFRYYIRLGYSDTRFYHILDYIKDSCLDDASLFQSCKLLTDWPVSEHKRTEVVELANRLVYDGDPITYASSLWLLAKYGTPREIVRAIRAGEPTWRGNSFAARQTAAITPRLWTMSEEIHWVNSVLRRNGLYEAIRVLDNLEDMMRLSKIPKDDRLYITPTRFEPPYPLYKVLTCIALLQSHATPAERRQLKDAALEAVGDPWYARLIGEVAV